MDLKHTLTAFTRGLSMFTWCHNQVLRKFSGRCSRVVREVDEAKVYESEDFWEKGNRS